MQKDLAQFKALSANIAVVVRDETKSVADFWAKNKLYYLGIPDNEKKLGNLYQQNWKLLKLGLMPAMFVIAQDGKIDFVHYSSSMKDIPENSTILEVLKTLKAKTSKSKN